MTIEEYEKINDPKVLETTKQSDPEPITDLIRFSSHSEDEIDLLLIPTPKKNNDATREQDSTDISIPTTPSLYSDAEPESEPSTSQIHTAEHKKKDMTRNNKHKKSPKKPYKKKIPYIYITSDQEEDEDIVQQQL